MMRHPIAAVVLSALLSACVSGPVFDTASVDRSLTPSAVTAEPAAANGRTVQWGGVILATVNGKDSTRLEVLTYPLDSNGKPQRDHDALGRVLFEVGGYLEPATYAADRMITLVGKVRGIEAGKVGESDYVYPLVSSEQLYLWPKEDKRDNTGVHFGVGVGFGL
jgi:outer membrane lipoprotein